MSVHRVPSIVLLGVRCGELGTECGSQLTSSAAGAATSSAAGDSSASTVGSAGTGSSLVAAGAYSLEGSEL